MQIQIHKICTKQQISNNLPNQIPILRITHEPFDLNYQNKSSITYFLSLRISKFRPIYLQSIKNQLQQTSNVRFTNPKFPSTSSHPTAHKHQPTIHSLLLTNNHPNIPNIFINTAGLKLFSYNPQNNQRMRFVLVLAGLAFYTASALRISHPEQQHEGIFDAWNNFWSSFGKGGEEKKSEDTTAKPAEGAATATNSNQSADGASGSIVAPTVDSNTSGKSNPSSVPVYSNETTNTTPATQPTQPIQPQPQPTQPSQPKQPTTSPTSVRPAPAPTTPTTTTTTTTPTTTTNTNTNTNTNWSQPPVIKPTPISVSTTTVTQPQ